MAENDDQKQEEKQSDHGYHPPHLVLNQKMKKVLDGTEAGFERGQNVVHGKSA